MWSSICLISFNGSDAFKEYNLKTCLLHKSQIFSYFQELLIKQKAHPIMRLMVQKLHVLFMVQENHREKWNSALKENLFVKLHLHHFL